MPELPEVETIVKGLRELIVGHKITEVIIRENKLIAFPTVEEFKDGLKGKIINRVNRRGKYVLIEIAGYKTLVTHLRMTGRLLIRPREMEYTKHTHIIFELDGDLDLRFHNLRKFGRMYLIDTDNYRPAGGLYTLGPEPLAVDYTLEMFTENISRRRGNIKALLLNQGFLAGLGNIYADEALFLAHISPERSTDSLNKEEISRLYYSIREVLKKGIEAGGTSFSDYRDARGEKGNFQNELKVYQQEGKNCVNCGHEIIKTRIAGRGTHYCPNCQK